MSLAVHSRLKLNNSGTFCLFRFANTGLVRDNTSSVVCNSLKDKEMTIALGIDTGGTYTDAVLVDHNSGVVLAGAKSLTTRRDLSIGIGQAVTSVFAENGQAISPTDVDLVALSTTLATNAIVEGQGSPVCLLLIGYNADLVRQYGFEHELVTEDVIYLPGGHNGMGDEMEPLDEHAVREAILARCDHVEAFAVSGYFGVRNPSHELRVQALVEELTRQPDGKSKPVTCGHELTTRLNSIRRATTAALNARLIPLLQELISTVKHTLEKQQVDAPLMVVKGDGSLVRAEWAMQRPIETILSGPAASVVGAWHLSNRGDVWVVDVGGTTTDIAALVDGRPRVNPEGAQVGRWQTMVEAVDVHTVGLGGDSQIQVNGKSSISREWLTIGPRRVVPLCLLAAQHPEVVDELRLQLAKDKKDEWKGQFVVANRQPRHALSEREQEILACLASGPKSLISLASEIGRHHFLIPRQLAKLRTQRLVLEAGFTPTDALHVLDHFQNGDAEASRLAAGLLAAQAGLSPEDFCRQVISGVSDRIATELISKVLSDEVTLPHWEHEPAATALLSRALNGSNGSGLDCQLSLKQPVVAIGAPVEAYLPRTSQQLHTELIVPDHSEVANAVGAVAGVVVQQAKIIIRPLEGAATLFRVHLSDGVHDFGDLEEGVAYAESVVPRQLETLARQAGAGHVEVNMTRKDNIAPIKWGGEIYLDTELVFTAVGSPSLVNEK
jgi:N-methylhydantoinase A/oxoprolinase/acetone carboxylase beta subunit